MTFEPVIHTNEWLMILQVGVGAILSAILVSLLTFWYLHLTKSKEPSLSEEDLASSEDDRAYKASYAGFCAFILGGMFLFFGLTEYQYQQNVKIVSANVTQKYQVEELTFAPRTRGTPDYYPQQSEPQPVLIKSDGKTRPAILTHNRETSEPTLTDVDTGAHMDDILRASP